MGTVGCSVACRPAAPDLDLIGFDSIGLGSAVHDMAWLSAALEVLQRISTSGDRPVWCFSVGAVNPRGRFTRYVARLEAERVGRQFPVGFALQHHRVFGGVVTMDATPLWGRLMYRMIGARAGDNRDWPAIEAWARDVAAALTTAAGRIETPLPGDT